MSDWQTIDTAPRTGEHILAVCDDGGIGFGWWGGRYVPTQAVVHWFRDGFYTSVNEREPEKPFPATHWKPLDLAPSHNLPGRAG